MTTQHIQTSWFQCTTQLCSWLSCTQSSVCFQVVFLDGSTVFAEYGSFIIGDEASTQFKLSVSNYQGDAGWDALREATEPTWVANGMKFSTPDRDNDGYAGDNCALITGGGWWYNICSSSSLNEDPGSWKLLAVVKSSRMIINQLQSGH